MKRLLNFTLLISMLVLLLPSCKKDEPDPTCEEQVNELSINHVQVLGSHNSYRTRTYAPILQYIYDNLDQLPPGFSPDDWDYTHVPLDEQLGTYGIRNFELDVYNDPDGGLFYTRIGNTFVGESPESNEAKLLEPGLKVLHFPDVDYNTNYLTFKDALTAIKNWSGSNPNHLPISIMVEPKEVGSSALLGEPFTTAIPFDNASLGTIDQEIKDIFGENLSNVITPDMVRGTSTTLNEAVLAGGWPLLAEARGKVIFILLPSSNELEDYLSGHISLENRVMFAFSEAGQPEAAFLKYDDPEADEALIRDYVADGYMVRTRADANTVEARTGSTSRFNAALNSGAQIISTDYYRPDGRTDWSDYFVEFSGGDLARLNPVLDNMVEMTCEVIE